MRAFIISCMLPLVIAVFLLLKIAASPKTNELLFTKKAPVADAIPSKVYITNFAENAPSYQDWFLKSNKNADVIFLLGSSELTNDTYKSVSYNFISQHFTTKVYAVGCAGNQCFSIYSQLLANEERLKNAPIVIILSPLWFQSTYAQGTNPNCFLQYTTEKYLNKIIHNDSMEEFKKYEFQRISDFYATYTSPTIGMRNAYILNSCSKNYFSKLFYSPVIFANTVLMYCNSFITNSKSNFLEKNSSVFKRSPIVQDSVYINWDSLFTVSKNEALKKSTNNNWYVNDDYFNKYVNGEHKTIAIVDDNDNQELKDFEMLLQLVYEKKANASFLILPMNPYCYNTLKELTPLVSTLDKKIKDKHFKCLNMWVTDSAKFEKGILTDIMHPGEYGWYKIDKFIIDTYSLNKYNHE